MWLGRGAQNTTYVQASYTLPHLQSHVTLPNQKEISPPLSKMDFVNEDSRAAGRDIWQMIHGPSGGSDAQSFRIEREVDSEDHVEHIYHKDKYGSFLGETIPGRSTGKVLVVKLGPVDLVRAVQDKRPETS